jgi:hypothetical protein
MVVGISFKTIAFNKYNPGYFKTTIKPIGSTKLSTVIDFQSIKDCLTLKFADIFTYHSADTPKAF